MLGDGVCSSPYEGDDAHTYQQRSPRVGWDDDSSTATTTRSSNQMDTSQMLAGAAEGSAGDGSAPPPSMIPWCVCIVWSRAAMAFNARLENVLRWHGRNVGLRPYTTIAVTVIICLGLMAGLLRMEEENDTGKLFAPRQSQAQENKELFQKLFPYEGNLRYELFVLTMREGGNILNKGAVDELWRLHGWIMAVAAEHGGKVWTYEELCYKKVNETCHVDSPLQYWQLNEDQYLADGLSVPEAMSDNARRGKGETLIYQPSIIGSRYPASGGGRMQSAEAFRIVLFIEADTDSKVEAAKEWEGKVIGAREEWQRQLPSLRLDIQLQSSFDDELSKSSGGDFGLFIGTIVLIMGFSGFILANPKHPKQGHVLVAIGGIATSLLATGTGFGICALVGVPFVSFVSLLLFLVIGVGVDDTLILTHEYDRTAYTLPPCERLATTFSHVGTSVTLTNLTSFLAFCIGAASAFRAITYFCLYAAVTILVEYILSFTLFGAILVIDDARIRADRLDVFPCIKVGHNKVHPGEYAEPAPPIVATVAAHHKPSSFQQCMRTRYAPLLLKAPVKIAVVFVFVGVFALSCYGMTQVRQGLDMRLLFVETSYLMPFIEVNDKHFPLPYAVQLIVHEKPFSLPETQRALVELGRLAAAYEGTEEMDGVFSWVTIFLAYVRGHPILQTQLTADGFVPAHVFDAYLESFLNEAAYAELSEHLVFDGAQRLIACRLTARTTNPGSSDPDGLKKKHMRAMTGRPGLREAIKSSPLDAADHFEMYIYFEGDEMMVSLTIQNLTMTIVAVALVCSVLLTSLPTTFFVMLTITMIDVDLFGWMYAWDLALDTVTMINLVMAVGFSVDFSAHTTHAFMNAGGTRDQRVVTAISEMGTSVLFGGMSTFVGMFLLAFANAGIFRVFFKMMAGIMLLGVLHGLVFVPVILGIIGPASAHAHEGISTSAAPDHAEDTPVRD